MAEAPHGTEASVEHAAANGGEHAAVAFPPFDPTLFSSQLIWFALTFGALYLVLSRVVLPKVGAVVERRAATLKADLDLAHREGEAAEAARKQAERVAAEARAEARKTIEAMRLGAASEFAAEQQKAEQELGAKAAEAETRINGMRDKALAQVGAIADDLAKDIVARLTRAA